MVHAVGDSFHGSCLEANNRACRMGLASRSFVKFMQIRSHNLSALTKSLGWHKFCC
jgi:hypothetical protein